MLSQDTHWQGPMTFAQLGLGAAFLEELYISFTERGLPETGKLSVETILAKAHSLMCASEDDQAFNQASEASDSTPRSTRRSTSRRS